MSITGDQFEELHEEFWGLVYSIAKMYLQNHERALDAAQDVFIKKWRARDQYDLTKGPFKPYVAKNTRNHCISILRHDSRLHEPEIISEVDHLADEQVDCFDDCLLTSEVIQRCITTLPIRERQCLILRYFEEMTIDEIAETLKLSVAQVRTGISRGLKHLRELLVATTEIV